MRDERRIAQAFAPCCGALLHPTHERGDRAVACPRCDTRLTVRARPYQVLDYRVEIDITPVTEGHRP